ncbi:ubiquitin domain-containing protein ubfd1 [Anaeramoeba ignava]|uniref:Ubiquitin domain-containing protein ubfd1 n=1 Tax=Anaeramoeba ignava TaxID=1746090 RepID=A0A9Q0R878_ANAIG|nr:ubiquitin domain-containing protein ubfd1 [Anaeramoeba ignava]
MENSFKIIYNQISQITKKLPFVQDFPKISQEIIDLINSFMKKEIFIPKSKEGFFEETIFNYLKQIQKLKLDSSLSTNIQNLYQSMIKFVLYQLQNQIVNEKLLSIIISIFSVEMYMFESIKLMIEKDEKYRNIRFKYQNIKKIKKLDQKNPKFTQLKENDTITPIYQHLTQVVFEIYLKKIIDGILLYLESFWKNLTDYEELYQSTRIILSYILFIKEKIPSISEIEPQIQIIDFKMKLAKILLDNEEAKNQKNGIKFTIEIINEIQNLKNRSENDALSHHERGKYEKQFKKTQKNCLDWLKNNRFIEKQFKGEKKDGETLQLVNQIIKFYGKYQKIPDKLINDIWALLQQDLSSNLRLKQILTQTLITITKIANKVQINDLNQKIQQVKRENYDFNFLELISSVTFIQISKNPKSISNLFGLETMWNLIQDGSGISSSVASRARVNLKNILIKKECKKIRNNYILLCIQNIQKHQSVLLSLELIKDLVSYSGQQNKIDNKMFTTKIKKLQQEHKLMDLFFEDFKYYHEKAQEGASKVSNLRKRFSPDLGFEEKEKEKEKDENENENENEKNKDHKENKPNYVEFDISTTPIVGVHSHLKEIEQRLQFLDFILTNTNLTLSFERFAQIWGFLVEKSISKMETDAFFQFIESLKLSNQQYGKGFELPFLEKVFTKIVEYFDHQKLNMMEYSIFRKFFTTINRRSNKIIPEYETITYQVYSTGTSFFKGSNYDKELKTITKTSRRLTGNFLSETIELKHLDYLWKIFLDVENEEVLTSSQTLLTNCYLLLSPTLLKKPEAGKQVQEEFISEIMKKITTISNSQQKQPQDEEKIRRCLSLLHSFIQSFDKKKGLDNLENDALKPHQQKTQIEQVSLPIQYNKQNHTMTFHDSLTIKEFRRIIQKRLKIKTDGFKLYYGKLELNKEEQTLRNLKINDLLSTQSLEVRFEEDKKQEKQSNKDKDKDKDEDEYYFNDSSDEDQVEKEKESKFQK